MTDAKLVAELRVCSFIVPYGSAISRRELVSGAAAAIERLIAERDALAARVERLTRLEWDDRTLMVGPMPFGTYWWASGGRTWRCEELDQEFATEAEACAAMEAAAREACK